MRENKFVQTRFLLGPAGSGKTFRCLAEIRAALQKNPDGAPLILLAPKQATFQLERQLLEAEQLSGFSRLHILSFDRLAKFIFEKLNIAPPELLSAEGRLMVLRALLLKHASELKLFQGSARRAGFAQELSGVLAELQEQQFTPQKLRSLAAEEKLRRELRDKLDDLALLAEKYTDWLREHKLSDANNLLDFATNALRAEVQKQNSTFQIEALWLDGFAEMTPQELALLTAILPFCEKATLAFCLETEPTPTESWLSIWSAIGKTFQQCRDQIKNLPNYRATIEVETLPRELAKSRFTKNSQLAELEASWSLPVQNSEARIQNVETLGLVVCANPEAEAIFAAREILKFVRAGNRFRDCAVLVRQLNGYHKPLARIFRRYEIPFFLDRRESVAHHPLAELTRNALRTVAFDWQNDDWFAVLKCGFSPVAEMQIDELENRAREFGWRGKKWLEPLPEANCERCREIIFPPFKNFYLALKKADFLPTGETLAIALRELWCELKVEATLERWTLSAETSAIHATVWEQMNSWLENLALAFPDEAMPLRDWLPILEVGLGNLTVGVIPPALDEVLIGAIDRARNPNLKFVLALGMNESVFPATPAAPVILTNADRAELEQQKLALGASLLDQISRERYLGYIACTRASEKLALVFSKKSADGKTLNPSPFIAQAQRIFPELIVNDFFAKLPESDAEHANELAKALMLGAPSLLEIPALKTFAEKLAQLREADAKENLTAAMAQKLYGLTLRSSVSRLEEFAACPFKFFVKSGLRANERKVFELDARERGNFQHDVLKKFHDQLQTEGKRWRDLEPLVARERVGKIAATQMETHRHGLFQDSAETQFAARAMTSALEEFIEVIVGWMRTQYDFYPVAAELGFGGKGDVLPSWEMDLSNGFKLVLNGRIDRVDLWCDVAKDEALVVVMDYKSGGKKLEPVLMQNGIQLQLLAYLGVLAQSKTFQEISGAKKLIPAGAFYVSLRGKFESGTSRNKVLDDVEAKKLAYQHHGRFDASELRKLDRRDVAKGDQFNFKLNKGGEMASNSAEAISCKELTGLLDEVKEQLCSLGEKILAGAAAVTPYRKGKQTPCEFCDYRAICRMDEWTQEFRELRKKEKSSA